MFAISRVERSFGLPGKLFNDAPQQSATNLERRLFPGRKCFSGKKYRRDCGFVESARFQVFRNKRHLLQLLGGRGNRLAGFCQLAHGFKMLSATRIEETVEPCLARKYCRIRLLTSLRSRVKAAFLVIT